MIDATTCLPRLIFDKYTVAGPNKVLKSLVSSRQKAMFNAYNEKENKKVSQFVFNAFQLPCQNLS
jgi:hypothetical protein